MQRLTSKFLLGAALMAGLVAGLIAASTFEPSEQPFGYISAPAASGTNVGSGNERLYAAWFDKDSYSGDLVAIPLSSDGTPEYITPVWRARERLVSQDFDTGRFIVTMTQDPITGERIAAPFRWDQLSGAQRTLIDSTTHADPALTQSPILNFIRGDRSEEAQTAGNTLALRDRTAVLGDMIHSPPRYVAAPNAGHPFDGYLAFAVANQNRPARVFVGANDGMLHAFDASSGTDMGKEVFAYIPSMVMKNLAQLTHNPYEHRYFVDGPIAVADAYFDIPPDSDEWHTLLVGGLGAGGQGYYALDVTSADPISSEDNSDSGAGSKVLWELSDEDEPNLGYTYGRPSITRIEHNNTWVVLVSNGYLNTAADGNAGDGKARLLALEAKSGAVLGSIPVENPNQDPSFDTAFANNGLSSLTAIDSDGDFRADTAYAGDLNGNLWKFDLSGDPSGWTAGDATLLFTAEDADGAMQPITARPDVAFHPNGGFMVYFGTGRLLGATDVDLDAPKTQSLYAIHDTPHGTYPVAASDLLTQTLTESAHDNGTRVRVASNNPKDDDGDPVAVDWSTTRGWKVDLPPGERVLTDLTVRNRRLQLTTTNPVAPSGENWLLQLNFLTGGAPPAVAIDIDADNALSSADNVDGNGDGDRSDPEDRVVGQYQSFGLASSPVFAALDTRADVAYINHLNAITPINTPITPVNVPPDTDDPGDVGVRFGHFDLDTSTSIYPEGNGSTNQHTHEWDDKTGLTTVDFLKIPKCAGNVDDCLDGTTPYVEDTSFDSIQTTIGPTQQFIVVVSNTELSPGGILELNGSSISGPVYTEAVARHVADSSANPLPIYQLGDTPPAGVQQLSNLKMSFDANSIFYGGLIGTKTGCVKGNDHGPGGEYRNGALTVQLIDAAKKDLLHPDHHYATDANGELNDDSSDGLLWEATIFWHWSGACYGEAGWQDKWDSCFGDGGNICGCIKERDFPQLCSGDGTGSGTGALIGGGGGGDASDGCTVTKHHPNPRYWTLEFEERLCGGTDAGVQTAEFELEFDKDMTDEHVTLTVAYDDGAVNSQIIDFGPDDSFSSPSQSPLQFDLTQFEFRDKKIKTILMGNTGAADIAIDRITVSWSGGDSGQKLKKIKLANPKTTFEDFVGDKSSPATVLVPVSLAGSGGGSACQYTLDVDYLDAGGNPQSTSLTFDESLDGASGAELEVSLAEAELDDKREKVQDVLLRNTTDSAFTITGATLSWAGASAGQVLKKVKDEDDGDRYSGSGTSGVTFTDTLSIGGVTKTGSCPDDDDGDDDADSDSADSGSSSGGSDGSGGGSGSGSDGSGGSGGSADDGDDHAGSITDPSGGGISKTVGSGNNQTGRLLWREIID